MIIPINNNYFDIEIDNSHRDFYYIIWCFYNNYYMIGKELHITKALGRDYCLQNIIRSIFSSILSTYFTNDDCQIEGEDLENFKRSISENYPHRIYMQRTIPLNINFPIEW